MKTPESAKYGTPEHLNSQRQWFALSKQIAASVMERVLAERDLSELLEQDPVEDRHTDRCLRRIGQQAAVVGGYVALGIMEGLEGDGNWSQEAMFGEK